MAIPLKPFEQIVRWSGTVCPLYASELRALWAIARYGSYRIAAMEIGRSEGSLKNTLTTARRKLRVRESVTAVAYALEHNWLPPITLDDGFRRDQIEEDISACPKEDSSV